jgi:hypothetical protein
MVHIYLFIFFYVYIYKRSIYIYAKNPEILVSKKPSVDAASTKLKQTIKEVL